MKLKDYFALIGSIVICELAGGIGAIFTTAAIPTWYGGLMKPPLNPPSWVFGPVWGILYCLMGIGAFLVWGKGWVRKDVKMALGIFVLQFALNTLWSILFFGLHSPLLGLICLVAMWLAIVWTMVVFWKISRAAMWLLVPYILWVTFAGYLNLGIFILNR